MIRRQDRPLLPALQNTQVLTGKEDIVIGRQKNAGIRGAPGPQLERNFWPKYADTAADFIPELRVQIVSLCNRRIDSLLWRLIAENVSGRATKHVRTYQNAVGLAETTTWIPNLRNILLGCIHVLLFENKLLDDVPFSLQFSPSL